MPSDTLSLFSRIFQTEVQTESPKVPEYSRTEWNRNDRDNSRWNRRRRPTTEWIHSYYNNVSRNKNWLSVRKQHFENRIRYHSKMKAYKRSESFRKETGNWKRWLILFFYFLLNAEMAFQVRLFTAVHSTFQTEFRCSCSSQYQESFQIIII